MQSFNFTNDSSQSRDFFLCIEKVRIIPSSFCTFAESSSKRSSFSGHHNGSKFHKKRALLFFGNKVWEQSRKNMHILFVMANPFPNNIFILFVHSDISLNMRFNVLNSFWLAITGFNRNGKRRFFCIKSFTLPSTERSITFHESCKPFKEIFIRNFICRYVDNISFNLQRFFCLRNKMNEIFSIFSSSFSIQGQIFLEKNELSSFCYRKFFNFSDKSFVILFWTIPEHKIPEFVSNSSIYGAVKSFLKKIRNIFVTNSKMDNRISTWSQRTCSLSIIQTSKKSHHKNLNLVPFYQKNPTPATTKCNGPRINSSVCHSLNSRRKRERRFRSVLPPEKVCRLYVESNSKPNNTSALPAEYGSVFNIRILTSSEAAVARMASANSRDVYYNTVVGKQAVTHINQDGYSMNLIYRDPYYSGMLAQNATLAVKFAQAQAKNYGLFKPFLIDLEARWGDKAEAA